MESANKAMLDCVDLFLNPSKEFIFQRDTLKENELISPICKILTLDMKLSQTN